MDRWENRRLRLRELLAEFETLAEAARFSGMNQGYLSNLRKRTRYDAAADPNARRIGDRAAATIERSFQKPEGWLDMPAAIAGVEDSEGSYNTQPMPSYRLNVRWVPEISWVQAGNWNGIVNNFEPGDGEKWHATTLPISPSAYALRIRGDSMVAPAGQVPTYPDGSIIIVDPGIDAAHGADCVFRRPDTDDATFKRLMVDGGDYFLRPLNPAYPTQQIDESYHYGGTCIHVGMDIIR